MTSAVFIDKFIVEVLDYSNRFPQLVIAGFEDKTARENAIAMRVLEVKQKPTVMSRVPITKAVAQKLIFIGQLALLELELAEAREE